MLYTVTLIKRGWGSFYTLRGLLFCIVPQYSTIRVCTYTAMEEEREKEYVPDSAHISSFICGGRHGEGGQVEMKREGEERVCAYRRNEGGV